MRPDIPPEGFADNTINNTVTQNQNNLECQNSNNEPSSDPLINKTVFENRRKMAWISLWTMIATTAIVMILLCIVFVLFIYYPDIIASFTDSYEKYLNWASEFLVISYLAFTSIIISYMGWTSISWWKSRK